MSDQDVESGDPSAIDTGERIAVLRGLEEPASRAFGERLRRRIYRHQLGADLGRLGWDGPLSVILEMLKVFFGLVGVGNADEPKER